MATRSTRTSSSAPTAAPAGTDGFGPDWALDLTRQQLAVAAESATVLFRGFEAMRAIQEQAAQEASSLHASVAGRLRQPCSAAEMLALQGELLRHDLEGAARYWLQLTGAALEMGNELFACSARLVDTEDFFAPAAARILHS
jgi:hypothetical protein